MEFQSATFCGSFRARDPRYQIKLTDTHCGTGAVRSRPSPPSSRHTAAARPEDVEKYSNNQGDRQDDDYSHGRKAAIRSHPCPVGTSVVFDSRRSYAATPENGTVQPFTNPPARQLQLGSHVLSRWRISCNRFFAAGGSTICASRSKSNNAGTSVRFIGTRVYSPFRDVKRPLVFGRIHWIA